MRSAYKAFAMLVVIGVCSLAMAAKTPKADAAPTSQPSIRGTVSKVDGTNLIIKEGKGNKGKVETFATTDKTVVTIKGKAQTLADLKADDMVVITTAADGSAATITVGKGGATTKPAKTKKAKAGDTPAANGL